MSENCPYCSKEFANKKALGSHLHYRHSSNRLASGFEMRSRSESQMIRFRELVKKCIFDLGLEMPQHIEKIELALTEIPRGVSPILDRYREAFTRALNKEKLLKEVEEILRQEEQEN